MEIKSGSYIMKFQDGGVEVVKSGVRLYFNKRPMYAFIKTALSITEFYDAPYGHIAVEGGGVKATGVLKSPTGAELAFLDT